MAPIESWEGVEAYFVFSDSPVLIWAALLGAGAVCVYTIVKMAAHEAQCAAKSPK